MADDGMEHFRTLNELFDELVDLDREEQDVRIREVCADRPDLEAELRGLLAADTGRDLERKIHDIVVSEAMAFTSPDLSGTELGSWRILEQLGEGGMGSVYLAERADGEYEAKAAIKLVRGGIPDTASAARFRAERQILAALSHPGVAQLLDGGSTPDGTPYLVMEYVDGKPLTEWCEAHDADVQTRLELFLKVCDAVGHAHNALVAHRDLKPNNILVTGDGEPKLLDFGIAKIVEDMEKSGDGVTRTYGIMTPAYASPEQIAGGRAGVAADIYSLGVLLYELLSGRLPIETKGLTPAQLITRVTQDVPPTVSSVTPDQARRRRLAGDLDAIVSLALRKEPEERYPSVEALADDVRLHLQGLPIRARRDDWRYRTGKLLRRNAGVVSGSALLLILGVTFGINAVLQARAVARERDRAEAQRAAAERVSGFLEGLFIEADPNQATLNDVTVREILDRGAAEVLAELEEEPEIQASLALVLGRVLRGLGEYEAAEPLLDSALAVRRRSSGVTAADLAYAYQERGALAYELGDFEGAVTLHRESLALFRTEHVDASTEVASALDWLSGSLQELGAIEESVELGRAAVAAYRAVDPEPNAALASALVSFTDILRTAGLAEESLEAIDEGLPMVRQVYGDDHLQVAGALNQKASTLEDLGRADEAIALVEEGLDIRRATFDGPHVEIAASMGNLANMLYAVGRGDEAVPYRRRTYEMFAEIFPDGHPYVAASAYSLASLLERIGRVEEARDGLEAALQAHRDVLPPGHPNLAYPLTSLGRVLRNDGALARSEALLTEAYRVRATGLPEGHWHVAASGLELGLTLDRMGRVDEAEGFLEEAYTILVDSFGEEDERAMRARDALVTHLERRGMSERAEELRGSGP